MLALKTNICVEPRDSSPRTMSIMGGISTTKLSSRKRTSISKRPHSIANPISIPSTVNFPTPTTPTRKLFCTPITITAGADATPFPIHLEVLLTSSPFFAAAYNPSYSFKDSPSGPTTSSNTDNFNKLSLPAISPDDFEYFIQWLYTRTLDHEELTGPHPAYFRLIRLYGAADQLQVPALKNCIIDEIAAVADKTNSCPTPDDTRVVWDDESGCESNISCLTRWRESSVGSRSSNEGGDQAGGGSGDWVGDNEGGGIRELISDLFVWKKTDKLVAEHADQWDETFLREVVVKLKREKSRGDKAPWRDRARACKRYHVHDEWAPVCGDT